MAHPRQVAERPVIAEHPELHGTKNRCRDAAGNYHAAHPWIGWLVDRTATPLQLCGDRLGKVDFDLAHVSDDAARIQLTTP